MLILLGFRTCGYSRGGIIGSGRGSVNGYSSGL